MKRNCLRLISLLIFLCLVSTNVIASNSIVLGQKEVQVPLASGMILVREGPEFDALNRWQDPGMRHLAYIVNKAELDQVRDGKKETFDLFHVLTVLDGFEDSFLTWEQFSRIKSRILLNETSLSDDRLAKINQQMESASKGASAASGLDFEISTNNIEIAPPHVLGKNFIAQVSLVRMQVETSLENIGVEQSSYAASINAFMFIDGKMLNLVTAVPANKLDSGKAASHDLVLKLLNLNKSSTYQINPDGIQHFYQRVSDELLYWAEAGDMQAQFEVGMRDVGGSDMTNSIDWWKKSAAQGYAPALRNMGQAHETGVIVEEDHIKAYALFLEAAKKGYPAAKYDLGRAYENGIGVNVSIKKAAEWIKEAAQEDYVPAQTHLAYFYASGRGLPVIYSKCYVWARIALLNKDETASEYKEACGNRLTSDELESADKNFEWELYRMQRRENKVHH